MTPPLVLNSISTWPFMSRFFTGWVVAGAVFVMIFNRESRWVNRARRLARQSSIELPSPLEGQVARRLRNEGFASLVLYPFLAGPLYLFSMRIGLQGTTYSTTWFPRFAIVLPILLVCYSFGTIVVARWNSPGTTRVSHFRQARLREAFTHVELITLAAGVCATVGASSWGLWKVRTGASWWFLDFMAVALAGVVWWRMEVAVLRRPSMASDSMELAWDDLLRFRRVRTLAIGAAWMPPFIICMLDFLVEVELASSHGGTSTAPPIYVPIAVVAGVYLIFRQGRQLWRMVSN